MTFLLWWLGCGASFVGGCWFGGRRRDEELDDAMQTAYKRGECDMMAKLLDKRQTTTVIGARGFLRSEGRDGD